MPWSDRCGRYLFLPFMEVAMSSRACLCLLLLLASSTASAQEPAGWFPFVRPWDDDTPTVTSAAPLNATEAGADGFVQTRDGRLVDGKGRRLRFLGVNLVFAANFPHKTD